MKQKREIQVPEQAAHPLRSERFYVNEKKWYFKARDNSDQGPFASKDDAVKGLEVFLAKVAESEAKSVKLNNIYKW